MVRTKVSIFFVISLAVLIVGCSRSTPGYAISRIENRVIVFATMQDASKIVEVKLENNTLKLHIDTGDTVEERVIPLQINIGKPQLLPVAAPYETLEIQGTNKINGYAVVHLKITEPDPEMKAQMPQGPLFSGVFKVSSGWKISGIPKKNTLTNSGAFRLGDRITAYCLSEKDDVDRPKAPGITYKTYREVNIDRDNNKNHILTIETYDATDPHKVKMIRRLQFLLKDLQDHETVSIEEITNLGEEIFIADLEVIPKESGSIKHTVDTNE